MTWLKLDDRFTQHPKLAGWTPTQKWSWLEVLAYCARYNTGGRIPGDSKLISRTVTPALLRKAEQAGLIDRADDGGLVVHDWLIYNGRTVVEKVAYCLARHPNFSANAIYREVGGMRELVLAEVAKQRGQAKPAGSKDGSVGGSDPGSKVVQARPVPLKTFNPPTPLHRCACGRKFKTERALALHAQNVHDGPPVPLADNELDW